MSERLSSAQTVPRSLPRSVQLAIGNYGPTQTAQNTPFNVQPDGMSALWFVINDPNESDLVVEFDGVILKSARTGNVISARVPGCLLGRVRVVKVRIIDEECPERFAEVSFEVHGKGDDEEVLPALERRMSQPNFFIIGAPRSGTTSLYWRLRAHPKVYSPRIKEPFFFDKRAHGVLTNAISEARQYHQLFAYTPYEAQAIGEASTTYLSSEKALRAIYRYNPEAKIVVMLRNPVTASISMYLQTKKGGKYERAATFEEAWRQSINGENRPFIVNYPELFQIGRQLSMALSIFGRHQVKVILFDDLVANSGAVYLELLNYLGLAVDDNSPLARANSAPWSDLDQVASRDLILEMLDYFQPEVALVEKLISRDLKHWSAL